MSEASCPFCNALVAPGQGTCPRCGETFAPTSDAITTRPTAAPAATPYRKPAGANRLVGGVVLGVMGVMAAVGLAYALVTVDTRREHDKLLPRSSRRPALPPLLVKPPSAPVAPARLAAMAYLMPGTTLVAGVHVSDLLASPVGERLKAEPLKVAGVELSLDAVEGWLGVPAGNIDHLALGSVLEEGGVQSLTPPTVLVIRTREPVGINRLREALKAESPQQRPTPEGGKRAVSKCQVKGLPLELWLPNSTTVVIGGPSLDRLPATPADDNARIVPDTRGPLEERLGAGTAAWAVVSAAKWKDAPLLATFKALPLGKLDGVRAVAVGVPRETPLRVQASVRAADEAAAVALEKQAEGKGRLKVGREKEWLSLQLEVGG